MRVPSLVASVALAADSGFLKLGSASALTTGQSFYVGGCLVEVLGCALAVHRRGCLPCVVQVVLQLTLGPCIFSQASSTRMVKRDVSTTLLPLAAPIICVLCRTTCRVRTHPFVGAFTCTRTLYQGAEKGLCDVLYQGVSRATATQRVLRRHRIHRRATR